LVYWFTCLLLENFTMTKSTTIIGSRDAAVGTLIKKAGNAAGTMLQCCKDAAAKAAAQLNPATPFAGRIAAVVALYADDFKAAGHNVKSLFVDALTLHAAAQTPVTVDVVGKDGKKAEKHIKAADAVTMPKHAMRDAAKQVREANGVARKVAPKTVTPKAKAPAATPAPDMQEIDAFTAWLDNLPEYLGDAVYRPKIEARLIEKGYILTKAAKGVRIHGKAAA
jgi:hypothetical protein